MIYHKTLFFQYGGQSLIKTHKTQETTHLRQKDLFQSAPLVPLTFFLPEAERLSTPLVSWVGGIQEESSSPSSCRTRRPSKVVRCSKELFCTYISSEICCSLNGFILPHLSQGFFSLLALPFTTSTFRFPDLQGLEPSSPQDFYALVVSFLLSL